MSKEAEALARIALNSDTFQHSGRVAAASGSYAEVGWLHDVLEDSSYSVSDLSALGFSTQTIEAVVALTRRSGEVYADYINRVKGNAIARVVKLADLNDNLNNRGSPPRDSLKTRYEKAQQTLGG